MATDGLPLRVRAGLVLAVLCLVSRLPAQTPDDRAGAVSRTLAVQIAMQQARDLLLHHHAKAAVEALEAQLSAVDGNASYLALLRDAYRTHIKELQLANQAAAAQVYQQRLALLEPHAESLQRAAEPAKTPAVVAVPRVEAGPVKPVSLPAVKVESAAAPPAVPVVPPKAEAVAALAKAEAIAAPPAGRSGIVARAKLDDDDPFRPPLGEIRKQAQSFLTEAEQAFGQRRYRDAGRFFQKAHQVDPNAVDASRERWAYCMLYHVVEELNQPTFGGGGYPDLESEVKLALQLAPRLDYGKTLLAEIDKRRTRDGEPAKAKGPPAVPVKYVRERNADGWELAETTNFRIYHNQSREYVEQVARIVEFTRVEMQRKWFGATGPDWKPKCEVYLHATKDDYSRATNTPPQSPGHSSFSFDEKDGGLLSRRMDLHVDNLNLLNYVLPHETTHTVLAGNFGERPIPRWADEGMAVLTEPIDKVEVHLKNLPDHRRKRELFPLKQLLQMAEYPGSADLIGAFYAESVSIVDYLVRLKGSQTFTQFVREGMYTGYEGALQKHYGFRSFNELEENWVQFAFEGGRARNAAKRTE
jgi:tetratricopeptide (TPR) repeat protein